MILSALPPSLQYMTVYMGVDPSVDRGTCPPYFLGVDIVCYLRNSLF